MDVDSQHTTQDITMDTETSPSSNVHMEHIIAQRRENYNLLVTPMLSSPSSFSDLDFVLLDRKMTLIYFPTISQALAAAEYLDSIAPPTSPHKGNIISFNHFELYPDLDQNAEQILVVCICHHPPLDVSMLGYVDRAIQFGWAEDILTLERRIGDDEINGIFVVPEAEEEGVDKYVLEFARKHDECRKTTLERLVEKATEERERKGKGKRKRGKTADAGASGQRRH